MTRPETHPNPAQNRTVAQRILTLPGAALRAGRDWIRDARYIERHRRLVDELRDGGVLDEMLEHTGATRDDLKRLRLPPFAAAQLLTRMMRRLGIRAPATAPAEEPFWHHDAQWQCLSCDNWRRCRRWLESRRRDDDYRAFCPNAGRFDLLRARAASPGTTVRGDR